MEVDDQQILKQSNKQTYGGRIAEKHVSNFYIIRTAVWNYGKNFVHHAKPCQDSQNTYSR